MIDQMNISFAGCGFLGIYHIGVASCLKTYAPHLFLNKVSGASFGTIAALALLADAPLDEACSDIIRIAGDARASPLGPFSPSFNINNVLHEALHKNLPDNIHEIVNGRLHISLTRVYDGKNLLVNQFSSKEEVIQAVMSSCFIPVFSGWLPPRHRGVRVIDGGYSDNLPVLDGQTITVSPFAGNSNICPEDDGWMVMEVNVANHQCEVSIENLFRLGNVFMPPEPKVLARMCKCGFDDALRFLQKRCMISCTRCLTLQSTYQELDDNDIQSLPVQLGGCLEYDPNCLDCKLQRQVASQSCITQDENVWQEFERAIDQAEEGFSSWLLQSQATRIIGILSKPATLPISAAKGFIHRLTSLTSRVKPDLKLSSVAKRLIDQLYLHVSSGSSYMTGGYHTARYTCDFNITQYGEDGDCTDDKKTSPESQIKDILSLSINAHLQRDAGHELPNSQKEAKQFQAENLDAAVGSHSRSHSRVGSRSGSRAESVVVSRSVSRMGSRTSSMNSLHYINGETPDTIEQIRKVYESNSPVMSYYYVDADNQVKVTEIFDVTEADAALLVPEDSGVDYDIAKHSGVDYDIGDTSSTLNLKCRHESGGSEVDYRSRHKSNESEVGVKRRHRSADSGFRTQKNDSVTDIA